MFIENSGLRYFKKREIITVSVQAKIYWINTLWRFLQWDRRLG